MTPEDRFIKDIEAMAMLLAKYTYLPTEKSPEWLGRIRQKYGRKYGQPLIQVNRLGELRVNIGYAEVRGMFMAEKDVFLNVDGKTPDEIWDAVRSAVQAVRAEYQAEQEAMAA